MQCSNANAGNDNKSVSGHPKHIIVNARPKKFDGDQITYSQVVLLAYPDETNPDIIFTVTYVGPHVQDGTLVEGQSVEINNGMKFDVNKTNRS